MIDIAFNILNSKSWWNDLPDHKWIDVNEIPGCIFFSVWNLCIEKNGLCHIEDGKFKKIADYVKD